MTNSTPEQRAAVKRVQKEQARGCGELTHPLWSDVQTILNLLPADLTNPQPELPTEPGLYADKEGDVWHLQIDGEWLALWAYEPEARECTHPRGYAPFTRLVPERPTITREQVHDALEEAAKHFGLPVHSVSYAKTVHEALANGKGAES